LEYLPDQLQVVRAIHDERCTIQHQRYGRCLPFGDAVGDRWERARHLANEPRVSIGNDVSIYDSAVLFFGSGLSIGDGTWIGPHVVLDGALAQLSIGAYVSVSAGVQIYTHDSVAWALTRGSAPYASRPTTIGSHCHIGPNAVIYSGVTIGDGSLIGANSVVTKDVPPGTWVSGVPATPIRRIVVDGQSFRFEPLDE
jgi:acetyltransferase-like isoleucine patch superfamily enzyme